MGAIFPNLDREIEGVDLSSVSGKMINRYEPKLSEILVNNGFKPLMDFFGVNPLEYLDEEAFEDFEIPEEQLGEKWFEPEDGLRIVQFLINYLKENPSLFKQDTASLVEDLSDFENVLKVAQISNAKWHVEIEI